ncbi:response regulator [Bdellovibrionota bacterium FG-2]
MLDTSLWTFYLAAAGRTKGLSVLVVEDDLFMKPILIRILQSMDATIKVYWAVSVDEARVALAEGAFSLVIADYFLLGESNGLDLWRHCQNEVPKMPFVMVSGLEPDVFRKLINGKVVPRFLQKPFYPKQCRALVEDALGIAA